MPPKGALLHANAARRLAQRTHLNDDSVLPFSEWILPHVWVELVMPSAFKSARACRGQATVVP
eukprot:353985-Chlamydomonas_euryale.AAC.3